MGPEDSRQGEARVEPGANRPGALNPIVQPARNTDDFSDARGAANPPRLDLTALFALLDQAAAPFGGKTQLSGVRSEKNALTVFPSDLPMHSDCTGERQSVDVTFGTPPSRGSLKLQTCEMAKESRTGEGAKSEHSAGIELTPRVGPHSVFYAGSLPHNELPGHLSSFVEGAGLAFEIAQRFQKYEYRPCDSAGHAMNQLPQSVRNFSELLVGRGAISLGSNPLEGFKLKTTVDNTATKAFGMCMNLAVPTNQWVKFAFGQKESFVGLVIKAVPGDDSVLSVPVQDPSRQDAQIQRSRVMRPSEAVVFARSFFCGLEACLRRRS